MKGIILDTIYPLDQKTKKGSKPVIIKVNSFTKDMKYVDSCFFLFPNAALQITAFVRAYISSVRVMTDPDFDSTY